MQKNIDIDKLSNLAKLDISEEEKIFLQKDMEEIVGFASTLNEIQDVESSSNDDVPSLRNVGRKDECTSELSREKLMSNSKCKNEKYFCIPQIFE